MPKNTRITVATTTATSAIITPKRGPSPSMPSASSQVEAGIAAEVQARTLALGDWGATVRDPIDLLRAAFFAGAAVFALLGELDGVANLLVAGVALLAARAADLPRLYDLGFTLAMILTGWGEALGLYDAWKPYDNVVHVIVPMLTSQVAYIGLCAACQGREPRGRRGRLTRRSQRTAALRAGLSRSCTV
jgi:hypothetical protein